MSLGRTVVSSTIFIISLSTIVEKWAHYTCYSLPTQLSSTFVRACVPVWAPAKVHVCIVCHGPVSASPSSCLLSAAAKVMVKAQKKGERKLFMIKSCCCRYRWRRQSPLIVRLVLERRRRRMRGDLQQQIYNGTYCIRTCCLYSCTYHVSIRGLLLLELVKGAAGDFFVRASFTTQIWKKSRKRVSTLVFLTMHSFITNALSPSVLGFWLHARR